MRACRAGCQGGKLPEQPPTVPGSTKARTNSTRAALQNEWVADGPMPCVKTTQRNDVPPR